MGKMIDMTGWVMKEHGVPDSRLTVLEQTSKKSGSSIVWKCLCECGTIKDLNGRYVRTGQIKSCGCKLKEIRDVYFTSGCQATDITNQRFGKLLALNQTNKRRGGNIVWNCLCDCGNMCEATVDNLKSGNTKSCGCLMSWGEHRIGLWLQNNNIKYKPQYTFDDLISSNGGKLRFDFGVLNNDNTLKCLIEFQGEQHYKDFGYFGKFAREESDNLKREYCKLNNILLYEIRFDESVEDKLKIIFN